MIKQAKDLKKGDIVLFPSAFDCPIRIDWISRYAGRFKVFMGDESFVVSPDEDIFVVREAS